MTIYKNIPAFPKYDAGSDGTIRNAKTKRVLKNPSINNCGYRLAIIYRDNKRVCRTVHRLLGIAFLNLPERSKLVVDHINRDKLDNRLENLRVITQAENLLHSSVNLNRWKNRCVTHPMLNIQHRPRDSRIKPYYLVIEHKGKKAVSKHFGSLAEAQCVRNRFYKDNF